MQVCKKYTLLLSAILTLYACGAGAPKQTAAVADSLSSSTVSTSDSVAVDSASVVQQENEAGETSSEETMVFFAEEEAAVATAQVAPTYYYEPEEPKYQTPERYIRVYATDTTLKSRVYMFYYSPRMKTEEYPFEQHLGRNRYNNYRGYLDGYRLKRGIAIPDTIEPGAKLLFRSEGYEPYEVYVDSIGSTNSVEVKLSPKVYTSIAILKESKGRLTFDLVDEQPADTTFYGDCRPIYSSDGSHGDPLCAFSCMACCYPNIQKWQLLDAIRQSGKDVEQLYKALSKKKNSRCSFLLSYKDRRLVAEPEQLPNVKLDSLTSKLAQTNWRIDTESTNVSLRLVFATEEQARIILRQRYSGSLKESDK